MSDEVAGNLGTVDTHAVVADDHVEFIFSQYLFQPLSLNSKSPQQGWNACDKIGKEKPRVAVGYRVVLEEDEIALWAFSLQEGQGIATAAYGHFMPLAQKLLNDGNVSGGVAQTPIERTYKYMSHERGQCCRVV
jgi:hypothetical protein